MAVVRKQGLVGQERGEARDSEWPSRQAIGPPVGRNKLGRDHNSVITLARPFLSYQLDVRLTLPFHTNDRLRAQLAYSAWVHPPFERRARGECAIS